MIIKNKLKVLYLIILILLSNCSNTSIQREYYENGVLRSESQIYNGQLNGYYHEYNKKGILVENSFFKNGKLDGLESIYNNDGNIKSEIWYKNGIREGKCILYYENGNIRIDALTKNDTIVYYKKYNKEFKEIDTRRDINILIQNKKKYYYIGDKFTAKLEILGSLYNAGEIVVNCIIVDPDKEKEQLVLDVNNKGESSFHYNFEQIGDYELSFYYFIENDIRKAHKKSIKIFISPPDHRRLNK